MKIIAWHLLKIDELCYLSYSITRSSIKHIVCPNAQTPVAKEARDQ